MLNVYTGGGPCGDSTDAMYMCICIYCNVILSLFLSLSLSICNNHNNITITIIHMCIGKYHETEAIFFLMCF
jgi:hypothetical protein